MDMMAVVCMETFSCIALLTRARFSWLTGFQKIFEGSRNFFVTRFSGVAGAALAVTVIPWPDSLGQRSGCKAGLQGGVGKDVGHVQSLLCCVFNAGKWLQVDSGIAPGRKQLQARRWGSVSLKTDFWCGEKKSFS